uniref:Gamma-glutamyltranspeptidase 1 n=2 Tax=Culex pipiens TaxID=7175 RepID=A0A8D8FUV5_CULPI
MNQSKELTREIHPSNSEKEVNSSNNGKKQQECNKYIYSRWMVFLVLMSSIAVTLYFHNGKHNSPVKNNSAEFLMPPNPQRTDTKPVPSYTQLHIFKQAAVCSDSQVCSQVGRYIFEKNGSIVDATLATMFCSGLSNMQSMGIGGGFIMNLYIKQEGKAYTLDAREISAKASTRDMHLKWNEIIQPTIDICKNGFEMSKHMYDSLHTNSKVKMDKQLRQMYVDEHSNEFYKPGTIIKPDKLCRTLEIIAEQGGDSLYIGKLAEMFASDLKDMGSIITKHDLEEYEVRWNDSIPIDINGDIMYVIPPPASGILVSYIVNILKNYNFKPEDISSVNSTILTYHRIIEAFKHTYGKRTQIGDPKYVNIDDLVKNLTSSEYAENIRLTIDENSTKDGPQDYGGQFYIKDSHGTAHISVLGPNGDAISVTSSVNFYFGAAMTGNRTGIIVNSGMDDFSSPGLLNYFGLPGSERNYIQPQKRALSSMAPTIVVGKDGNVKLVVGAAGGTKITTAVAMIIIKMLWFNNDIKEAVDTPRIHHQLIPMALQYEFGNLDGVLQGLESKGHKTFRYRERGSIVCGIAQNGTGIYANADFRKGGEVVGF